MDKTAALKYRKNRLRRSRLELVLVAAIMALIVAVGVAAAFFLFTYVSKRNAPPTTYYDWQLREQRENLRRNPQDPAALTNVGYVYMKMGDQSKALSYFDRALALNEKFVPALYNKGMHFKAAGRRDEAIRLLASAGKNAVEGNKYTAYFSLGEMFFEQKKYDKALEYLDLAAEDNATIWNVFELKGRIYELKKDKAKALENYERAAAFNPNNAKLLQKIKELKNG